MTATAIRKRFDRLIETRGIEFFAVLLKPNMLGSEYLISLIYTDGSENEAEFIEMLGAYRDVAQVGPIVTAAGRLYFVHCEYAGSEGLQHLGTFFRRQTPMTNVEMHTILASCGSEFKIKKLHLQVLKFILEDARMAVNLISDRVGFTSRRVGTAIQEMQDSDAFWFTTRWNLSLGNSSEFYLQIIYDEQVTSKEKIDEWLRKNYPLEYWFSYYSAIKPLVFGKFLTDHFRDAEPISRNVKNTAFSKSVNVLLCYPVSKFPRLGRIKIEQLILDARLD